MRGPWFECQLWKKIFHFPKFVNFSYCVLVPFSTFSPYLEPKLFTIDPHFLNHKITKRRALMFALWTSLVKCPKVHKSLREKKRRFLPTFWHGLRPPKKLLGKRVNNAKSCRAKQQGKFSLCHLFSFYLFLLHPISPAWCEPFRQSSFWGQIPFQVPFPSQKSHQIKEVFFSWKYPSWCLNGHLHSLTWSFKKGHFPLKATFRKLLLRRVCFITTPSG